MAYERIITRINYIERNLHDLKEWIPADVAIFLSNRKDQAAIDRLLQTMIEAILDICVQLVKIFRVGYAPIGRKCAQFT